MGLIWATSEDNLSARFSDQWRCKSTCSVGHEPLIFLSTESLGCKNVWCRLKGPNRLLRCTGWPDYFQLNMLDNIFFRWHGSFWRTSRQNLLSRASSFYITYKNGCFSNVSPWNHILLVASRTVSQKRVQRLPTIYTFWEKSKSFKNYKLAFILLITWLHALHHATNMLAIIQLSCGATCINHIWMFTQSVSPNTQALDLWVYEPIWLLAVCPLRVTLLIKFRAHAGLNDCTIDNLADNQSISVSQYRLPG